MHLLRPLGCHQATCQHHRRHHRQHRPARWVRRAAVHEAAGALDSRPPRDDGGEHVHEPADDHCRCGARPRTPDGHRRQRHPIPLPGAGFGQHPRPRHPDCPAVGAVLQHPTCSEVPGERTGTLSVAVNRNGVAGTQRGPTSPSGVNGGGTDITFPFTEPSLHPGTCAASDGPPIWQRPETGPTPAPYHPGDGRCLLAGEVCQVGGDVVPGATPPVVVTPGHLLRQVLRAELPVDPNDGRWGGGQVHQPQVALALVVVAG